MAGHRTWRQKLLQNRQLRTVTAVGPNLLPVCQSPDADLVAGPAEAGGSQSKGQDRNELHERQKWSKARSVSAPSLLPSAEPCAGHHSEMLPFLLVASHFCAISPLW